MLSAVTGRMAPQVRMTGAPRVIHHMLAGRGAVAAPPASTRQGAQQARQVSEDADGIDRPLLMRLRKDRIDRPRGVGENRGVRAWPGRRGGTRDGNHQAQ